jgi:quercetin dioxygenase-like cupin family protein
MKTHDWSRVAKESLTPLITRQAIHTDTMTVALLELKRGAVVPRHEHPNEQITFLQRGRLLFEFDGDSRTIEAGQLLQIPGGAPHRVEALEDSLALDLFSPVREDWVRGDDAYLRR